MLVVEKLKHRRKACSVKLGRILLDFAPVRTDGLLRLVAPLPDDEDDAAHVRDRVRDSRRFYRIIDLVMPEEAPPPVVQALPPKPEPAVEAVSDPVAAAMADCRRNGWDDEDLVGVAIDGNPGLGRSPVTGLTLAEMMLTTPPEGWAERRAHTYPWEVGAWNGPSTSWRPAGVPPKPKPEEVPEELPEPPADLETPEEELEELDAELPSVTEEADVAALAAYGTPEQLQEAIGIVHGLAEASDSHVSYNKCNYYLRKAGLPTVGDDELSAMLTLIANT